jgi:hypothetical protein
MFLDVKVIQHIDFLEVVVTGVYDLRDAIDKLSYFLVPSQLTGVSTALIDFRDLTGNMAA